MAWGVDLWDQFDAVERHTGWGLEFLERLSKFVRERADVEASYAKQLRNLQKKFLPKRVTEEENSYTSCRAFFATLQQLGDYAGHRELLADTLADRVVGSLARYHAEAKQQRKALLFEGRRAQRHLDTCWKQLEESKRRCERDARECERARQTMQRHDCDSNSSRADVEKARAAAAARKRAAEDSRADFLGQRDGFNREQANHFYSVMPAVFHELEEMEACRLTKVREYLRRYSDAERKVLPAIGGCLDEVARAADSINERQGGRADEVGDDREGREARLDEELQELRELPPDQRRRRLLQRLDETERDLRLDHDQRVALLKMRGVYSDTPSLGDAASLEPQLAEVQARSRALTHARRRLQQLLAETEGRDLRPDRRTQRRSVRPSQPPVQRSGDGAGDPRAAGRAGDSEDEFEDEFEDDFDDDDEENEAAPPAASQCRALYSFTADSEDSLSVVEGEILFVVASDGGDGWTRVRRGSDEGYVPTSYIELHAGGGGGDAAITYI